MTLYEQTLINHQVKKECVIFWRYLKNIIHLHTVFGGSNSCRNWF